MAPRARRPTSVPLEPLVGGGAATTTTASGEPLPPHEEVEYHFDHEAAAGDSTSAAAADDEYEDPGTREHFRGHPPIKSILLGVFLLSLGTLLLVLGVLVLNGIMFTELKDNGWAFIFVGLVTFVPGFWAVRIAILAYLGDPEHSFHDLPDY